MALGAMENFAFQPWSRETAGEGSLKDFLARVDLERGHFRTITEASLQEEIAAEGALELSESEDEDEDEEGEDAKVVKANGRPATKPELFKAKNEMLVSIRAAEQELSMARDFVSLLVSKHAPKQGQSTMSQILKEAVPLGSLGTDVWQNMAPDTTREALDDLLATNVRLQGLQQSADSLLSAANRLNGNVRKETEYWNQVMSITSHGWNVIRMPKPQQHRLGVRFGFSESSSEFSGKGLAALNTNEDGTILLDRGIGSRPKALRAVLRKNGHVIGSSSVPNMPDAEETTLEARIRYARDSLFDEELYREMIRESRTLASLGVRMKDSAILFGSSVAESGGTEVSLDLISLDEDQESYAESSQAEDVLAQGIVLASRLLLSQSHRDRMKKRSQIPIPLSEEKKDNRPLLPILRPIMAFIMHRAVLDQLNPYVEAVSKILSTAKIKVSHQVADFQLSLKADVTTAETLIALLMQPWSSTAKLEIMPPESEPLTFDFTIDTTLAYRSGSGFTLKSSSHKVGYRLDSIDELVEAADAKIASGLALAIGRRFGEEWQCNVNEASLDTAAGGDEKHRSIWISFNGEQNLLSLNSAVKKLTWRVDDNNPDNDFWNAARDMADSG